MPVCEAVVKSTGNPCTKQSKAGLTVCGIHAPRAPRAPPPPLTDEQRCIRIKGNWNGHPDTREQYRCDKKRHGEHDLCRTHYMQRVEAEARRLQRQQRWHVETTFSMNIWMFSRELPEEMPWTERLVVRRNLVERIIEIAGGQVVEENHVWMAMDEYRAAHPPLPEQEEVRLARIARDNQNTHTREVSEQTNKNLAILFKTSLYPGQDTIQAIERAWKRIFKNDVDQRIYADIKKWYDTETCRTQGDWLYRKVLDHLIAYIKGIASQELRRELLKRLQQECAESYGMCCDGHISRLANVLVGFDDQFKAEISKGEILQTRMAVISKIEDVEERFKAATALMAELDISHDEAGPWLDAISE